MRALWQRLLKGRIASSVQPLPIPPGSTDLVIHMLHGTKHRKTFTGKPGVASEEVARQWIRESGNFLDIGGNKFANVQEIREISLEKKA